MSLALTEATSPVPTTAPRVTAPPGTGFVVVPGGGVPGPRQPQTTQPQNPATIPGPQSDGSDFYGLAAALVIIVVAIFLVRKIVPLRRRTYVSRHPAQPPGVPVATPDVPAQPPDGPVEPPDQSEPMS